MRQFENAAMMEGAPCVAAHRQSLRVFLRRPAMPSAQCPMPREASIAALPHYQIAALLDNCVFK